MIADINTDIAAAPSADSLVRRFGARSLTLNLYPTENRMSANAQALLGSDLVSRYPGSVGPGFFYGDPADVTDLYTCAKTLAQSYFEVDHAMVQFLSGLHAMQSLISTLPRPGQHVTVLGTSAGGHYATEQICADFGHPTSVVPFDRRELSIDLNALAGQRDAGRSFYYLDLSVALRIPNLSDFRQAVGTDAVVCFDASHLLGLLPAVYDLPTLWSDVNLCTASTHKTFPGPQKAMMLTSDPDVADRMGSHLGFRVSSAHSNSVGALAVTLAELEASKRTYGHAVIANARRLGAELATLGLPVAGESFGFTDTHQLWVVPEVDDPVEWGRRLERAGVRSTVVGMPGHDRPGLRIGTQELTRVGMGPSDMPAVANIVRRALAASESMDTLRRDVHELVSTFPSVRTTFT